MATDVILSAYDSLSDCNSDFSGSFPSHSSPSNSSPSHSFPSHQRFLLSSSASATDSLIIQQLITDLDSVSIDVQKQAAMEIRLIAKNKPENRVKIAQQGGVIPLLSLVSSSDSELQEYGVTAILNLSLCEENKEAMVRAGAVKALVVGMGMGMGTVTAKENAACALLRLSQVEEHKVVIGRSGGFPLLVELLEKQSFRGKKDACTALYLLCSVDENKVRAIESGVMKPIVELMADFESRMVDKAEYVMSKLVEVVEGRNAVVREGGIPVLVEIVEVGLERQKEMSAAILFQICHHNPLYRNMVAREGAIPALVALSQAGTTRAKQKAEALIELLRQPRSGNNSSRTSDAIY